MHADCSRLSARYWSAKLTHFRFTIRRTEAELTSASAAAHDQFKSTWHDTSRLPSLGSTCITWSCRGRVVTWLNNIIICLGLERTRQNLSMQSSQNSAWLCTTWWSRDALIFFNLINFSIKKRRDAALKPDPLATKMTRIISALGLILVLLFVNCVLGEVRIESGSLNGTTIPSAQFYKKGKLSSSRRLI